MSIRKDWVEKAGVSDRGSNIPAQAIRIPPGLFLISGDPEIGLEQKKGNDKGDQDEGFADGHNSMLCARRLPSQVIFYFNLDDTSIPQTLLIQKDPFMLPLACSSPSSV